MSQHYHYPERAEFAKRLSAKSVPGGIKTAALGAVLGNFIPKEVEAALKKKLKPGQK